MCILAEAQTGQKLGVRLALRWVLLAEATRVSALRSGARATCFRRAGDLNAVWLALVRTRGTYRCTTVNKWGALAGAQDWDVGRSQSGAVGFCHRHAVGVLADADSWNRQWPGQEHPVTSGDDHTRRDTGELGK